MTYIVQYRTDATWHDYTTRLTRVKAWIVFSLATEFSARWRDGWRYRILYVDEDTRRVEQES